MNTLSHFLGTSAADKEKLVSMLRASKQRFLGCFAGVDDEQSRWHPSEGKWSVLDTVEHLTMAEEYMVKQVTTARRPKTAERPNREESLLVTLLDRSRKTESPTGGQPKGRFANLAEAQQQFEKAREEAIQFVEQCGEDLRATEVTHPHPAVGAMSTYEMLIFIAKHAERHALQIEEIKEQLARLP